MHSQHQFILIIILAFLLICSIWPRLSTAYKRWSIKNHLKALRAKIPKPTLPKTPHLDRMQRYTRKMINKYLSKDFESEQLTNICSYSVTGGKLIRAVITRSVATAIANVSITTTRDHGVEKMNNQAIDASSTAIEYIHAASLMLDDEMDMDEERRGKPSAFVKFGSAATQLGALQLMTNALVETSQATSFMRELYGTERGNELGVLMFDNVSHNLQQLGTGQFFDVFPIQNKLREEVSESLDSTSVTYVEDVIRKKTVTLFDVAFVNGWLSSNGSIESLSKIHQIAQDFGMLFQIADDCEDYSIDLHRAGKNLTMNYLIRYGATKTKKDAMRFARNVESNCTALGIWTSELQEMISVLKAQVSFFIRFQTTNGENKVQI